MTDGNGVTRRVERLEKDMWYGNGKPGITTRTESLESRVTIIEKYINERESRLQARMNIMITAIFTLAGAVILQLIFKH